jgi:hypothetical protein
VRDDLGFAQRGRHVEIAFETGARRYGLEQIVDGAHADAGEHLVDILLGVREEVQLRFPSVHAASLLRNGGFTISPGIRRPRASIWTDEPSAGVSWRGPRARAMPVPRLGE